MIDAILKILQENTLAQGGLIIAVFSSILLSLKSVPGKILSMIQRRWTSFIQLDHEQEPLKWMMVWLSQTNYGKKSKHLTVADHHGNLAVGSGNHYFFRGHSLVIANYIREYIQKDGVPVGRKETLSFRVIPGDRKILEDLIKEGKAAFDKRYSNQIMVGMPNAWGENWQIVETIDRPSLQHVVLTEQNETALTHKLERFVDNQDKCKNLGIPWRLGILMFGPPGNGKTSLAKAIAGHMGYNLYILSLNGISSDKQLLALCSNVPTNTVLLIEDIDTYNINRQNTSDSHLSLSGLLNALDGVTAKNGRITIMTTNNPESLDPALIRKGRADLHLELLPPTEDQLRALFGRFGVIYAGQTFSSVADAQDYLLNNDVVQMEDIFA